MKSVHNFRSLKQQGKKSFP